jgi:hypothetical protein
MQEKSACLITHQQIIEGTCPWCDRCIDNGNVVDATSGRSEIRWNWVAIENSLRNDNSKDRIVTLWNLRKQANDIERLLRLLEIAITDTDPKVRYLAEDVCRRIGRNLPPDESLRLEERPGPQGCELAAIIMRLGRRSLSENIAARAARP